MKIFIIDSYFSGSHSYFANSLNKFSSHDLKIFSLPGRNWKWRMHGGAITLANMVNDSKIIPDLFLCTSMLDVSLFKNLLNKCFQNIPMTTYFHENQWAYPLSENDLDNYFKRDQHYGFINLSTALVSDALFFNSQYNFDSFFTGCKKFLNLMRDYKEIDILDSLKVKSKILPLGFNPNEFQFKATNPPQGPIVLWNHRWEHDKGIDLFYQHLLEALKNGLDFKINLLGVGFEKSKYKKLFLESFEDRIINFGASTREDYLKKLNQSNICYVTSRHDFFGLSVMEAYLTNHFLILPKNLSYPEIYKNKKNISYYVNIGDGFNQLSSLLDRPFQSINNQFLNDYNWQHLVKIYDHTLENLCI